MRVAHEGLRARRSDASELRAALVDARDRTLATFDACERALRVRPMPGTARNDGLGAPGDAPNSGLAVPYAAELNPPCWELGHIGWFEAWWLARNPQRALGVAADPEAPRSPPQGTLRDALFDSSRVPHRERWALPLPSPDALRDELRRGLGATLALLRDAEPSDAGLYFFRLALFHEDMHHEAAVTMAQHLGVPLDLATPPPRAARAEPSGCAPQASLPLAPAVAARPALALPPAPACELAIAGGPHRAGWTAADGFAFDNELAAHTVELAPYRIDAAPVSWSRFVDFIDAGGYDDATHWSREGRAWRETQAARRPPGEPLLPRYLRRRGSRWERLAFGTWIDLDPALPATHLACHEAEAWCAWAGRRLPTEAEWEHAAANCGEAFTWGRAWDWTASPFAPYPGFVAHPYRDYSAPWFHTRRVLRGGSNATRERMKHPCYRNFFEPHRNDIVAGFRTCAVEA